MEQEEERLLEIIDEQKEKIAELGKEVNIIKAGNIALSRLAVELETKLADGDGAIDGLIDRINAMALVHGRLQQSDTGKMSMWMLTASILSQYEFAEKGARVDFDIPMDMALSAEEAIPCGWIINELVSNAFQHAFPDGVKMETPPEVKVAMKVVEGKMSLGSDIAEPDKIELIVSDNGVGFPDDFDFLGTESMGMKIVKLLVEQLDAGIKKIEVDTGVNRGTKFTIRFEI